MIVPQANQANLSQGIQNMINTTVTVPIVALAVALTASVAVASPAFVTVTPDVRIESNRVTPGQPTEYGGNVRVTPLTGAVTVTAEHGGLLLKSAKGEVVGSVRFDTAHETVEVGSNSVAFRDDHGSMLTIMNAPSSASGTVQGMPPKEEPSILPAAPPADQPNAMPPAPAPSQPAPIQPSPAAPSNGQAPQPPAPDAPPAHRQRYVDPTTDRGATIP
jgi:hypothetical protein